MDKPRLSFFLFPKRLFLRSSFLPCILAVTAVFSALLTSAQSNLPDVRGNFEGTQTRVISNCNNPVGPVGTSTLPIRFHTFEQTGANFRGVGYLAGTINGFVYTGTVSPSGDIVFSYSFTAVNGQSETGTGSGTVVGGVLTYTGSGTIRAQLPPNAPGPRNLTCNVMLSGTVTLVQPTTTANLAITNSAAPNPVTSGGRITYTQHITNAGPDAAAVVTVSEAIPEGTTFASLTTSQGSSTPPAVGTTGQVTYFLNTIHPGESATVTLTVNVLAASGQTISNTVTAVSISGDSNADNNSATTNTDVEGGAVVALVWDQPPPTPDNPTPAPTNLRVVPSGIIATESPLSPSADSIFEPAESSCMLLRVNVYKSDTTPVQAIAANLWKSVPPDQLQTSMASAPSGSFYVISNVWQCGSMTIESGGSNQAEVPAGPEISKVKGAGKMKITGDGFSEPSEIFIDGVGFAKTAKVSDPRHIVQKGKLSDGRSIRDAMPLGQSVIVSVRKSNGGISSLAYTRE